MPPFLPVPITTEEELESQLSTPTPAVLDALRTLDSDLYILGVGGKMGPTLARMAARALDELQSPYHVYGVARFSQPGLRERLEAWRVQTIACDLLDRRAVAALPDSRNLIYMAGQKFGTTGNEALTWAMNTYVPALVAERYAQARIVAFSTAGVYDLSPVVWGGLREIDRAEALGEYANSCLGRERIFEYFSRTNGLRCAIVRLSYAIDLRYGVLVDIAQAVKAGRPVNLEMGAVNVIWQGDANAVALGLLAHCAQPPFVVNVSGPGAVAVRRLAEHFGQLFNVRPVFEGQEAPTALIVDSGVAHRLFGYPQVTLNQMVEWVAAWVARDNVTLGKPTHFEVRDGRY